MHSGYEDPPRKGELPELPRSISTTNLDTTARCRNIIQQDWCPNAVPNGTNFFNATTRFTFTLPSLSGYPPDFQKFTFERIVDKRTQEVLETDRCLNWSTSLAKLIPLYTMGDGNCLLHATSLAMWGFQDRDFILRKAVHAALRASDSTSMLYQRWKYAREEENKLHSCELDPPQWQREWTSLVQQSSPEPALGMSLASLEEFHVFVLANILKRPIIMYSPTKMRSLSGADTLQPGTFHGVYLPLLWDARACTKDPLSLAFNGGHFSALVVFEDEVRRNEFLLPLSDCYGQDFPIKFMHPLEKQHLLIKEYFDYEMVTTAPGSKTVCGRLKVEKVPAYKSTLIRSFIDACSVAYQRILLFGNALCVNGCGLYGDPAYQGLCSRCYKERTERDQKVRPSPPMSSTMLPPPIGRSQSQPTSAIKCPTCSNPGHPNYLGMCEACFKKQQSSDNITALRRQGSGNNNYAGKPASVPQSQAQQYGGGAYGERRPYCSKRSKTMVLCVNECGLYGDPAYQGLCLRCYKERTERNKKEQNDALQQIIKLKVQAEERATRAEEEARRSSERELIATTQIRLLQVQLAGERERASTADEQTRRANERTTMAEQELVLSRQTSEAKLRYPSILQNSDYFKSSWKIERDEIEVIEGKPLGVGGWGEVRVAMFRGVRVAAKFIHEAILSPHNIHLFLREMNIAASVRHPNLVLFIGASLDDNRPVFITELMPANLRNIIEAPNFQAFLRGHVISVSTDVARGLNYLHLMRPDPIIHRDVSSANVLLEPIGSGNWKAKVSDYGSANFLSRVTTMGPGNASYAAPESMNPRRQSPKMDVYSYGILLLEMVTRKFPDYTLIDKLLDNLQWQEMAAIIWRCTSEDPVNRPTMKDLLILILQLEK